MKKHYLIGFIGIMIIFSFLGNSLLNLNSRSPYINKQEETSNGTGLTVTDNSYITFWNENGSETDEVEIGDSPESFFLEIEFNKENWNWHYYFPEDTSKYGLKLYNSTSDGLKTPIVYASYNQLNDKGEDLNYNEQSKTWTYTIEGKCSDYPKIENEKYEFKGNEPFLVKADYSYNDFSTNKEIKSDQIGCIETLNSISLEEKTIFDEVNVIDDKITSTEATVNYVLKPGKDVHGKEIKVDEVKWMNGTDELASSNDKTVNLSNNEEQTVITTNKLEPNEIYDNTTLVAISNENKIANAPVPSFTTLKDKPNFSDSPDQILIDTNNDILEIQGHFDTNGSIVKEEDFKIKKESNTKSNDDYKTTYVYSWTQTGDEITYDVYTDEYDFLNDPGLYSLKNDNLTKYSLEISYTLEGEFGGPITDDLTIRGENQNISWNEDLSFPDKNSIKLDPGEIAGITIAFLFLTELIISGIIVLIGNILYKRVNSKYSEI